HGHSCYARWRAWWWIQRRRQWRWCLLVATTAVGWVTWPWRRDMFRKLTPNFSCILTA
ncbi:hypothetical protein S83_038626, partial [Arachis hypogaea]